MSRTTKKQVPPRQARPSRSKPGRLVCGCGKGHASARDGLCIGCRGGTWIDMQRASDPLRNLGFDDCEVTSAQKG